MERPRGLWRWLGAAALIGVALVTPAATIRAAAAGATVSAPPCAGVLSAASAPVLGCAAPVTHGSHTGTSAGAAGAPAAPCVAVPKANDMCPLWTSTFDNPAPDSAANQTSGDDEPHAIRANGSHVFIGGRSFNQTSTFDMFVSTLDSATGNTLWTQRWSDGLGASGTIYAVAANPAGSVVYATGQVCGQLCSVETLAYDTAAGNLLWQTRFHDSPTGNDLTNSIAVSPDGSRVFVTGGEQPLYGSGDSTASFLTIAYNAATGAQEWLQTFKGPQRSDGNNLSQARRVAVDPAGHAVYVGGWASASGSQIDIATAIAYDPSTGSQLWVGTYTHQNVDAPYDMVLSPDGSRLYLVGLDRSCSPSCNVPGDSYATGAFNTATGSLLWLAVASSAGDAQRAAISPDGSTVYVTGNGFAQTADNYVAAVQAIDTTTGTQRWLTDVQAAGGDGIGESITATASPAEAVLTVGEVVGEAEYQTVGLAQATGAEDWNAVYNPEPANDSDVGWLVTSTPDSTVYVTGLVGQQVDATSGATNDIDGLTLAYRATSAPANVPFSPAGVVPLLLAGCVALLAVRRRLKRR